MRIVLSRELGHLDSDQQTVEDIETAISQKLPHKFSLGSQGVMAVAELKIGDDGEKFYYISPSYDDDDDDDYEDE